MILHEIHSTALTAGSVIRAAPRLVCHFCMDILRGKPILAPVLTLCHFWQADAEPKELAQVFGKKSTELPVR